MCVCVLKDGNAAPRHVFNLLLCTVSAVYMYICMYTYITYGYACVCVCLCVCVCIYIYIYIYIYRIEMLHVPCSHIYKCIYVCKYTYMYIYLHTYICTQVREARHAAERWCFELISPTACSMVQAMSEVCMYVCVYTCLHFLSFFSDGLLYVASYF